MKATIDLPDPLYRRLKAAAALEGRTIREVAIELFGAWLESHGPGQLQGLGNQSSGVAEERAAFHSSTGGFLASTGAERVGAEAEVEAGVAAERAAAWLRNWDAIWAAVAARGAAPPTTVEILLRDRR